MYKGWILSQSYIENHVFIQFTHSDEVGEERKLEIPIKLDIFVVYNILQKSKKLIIGESINVNVFQNHYELGSLRFISARQFDKWSVICIFTLNSRNWSLMLWYECM